MLNVFLDTNVLKFSIEKITRLVPRNQTLTLNGKDIVTKVYRITDIPVHEKVRNQKELYNEIKLLATVAELAKQQKINICTHFETIVELLGLPNTWGRKKGYFDGIEIKKIKAPIEYSRILGRIDMPAKETQIEFLKGIEDGRFKELQIATGAYQGEKGINIKQMLDAFHIWCAEHNKCDYFLTLDFSLIKHMKIQKRCKPDVELIIPSELIKIISDYKL